MQNFRLALLATTLLAVSAPSFAQSNDSNVIFDEVITRATKSVDPETVQDVPVAVTAFNADTLDALNVRDLESLSFSAPNVTLDDIGTTRGTANFSVRGLGVNSSIPSIDPTVGVFVDGVYLGVNSGVVFDVFDLESVEVLRGPQGLLFGRNTTGGAVLLNTTRPTDDTRIRFRAATESALDDDRGSWNSYVMGTLTGPLSDNINGKIAAYYNDDNGYFENRATGADFGDAETYIVRGALEFQGDDDRFSAIVRGEYFDSEGDGPAGQNRGVFERDSFDFAIDEEGNYDNQAYSVGLEVNYDVGFGDGTITNILAFRDYEQNTLGDIDSLPASIFFSPTRLDQNQISNELRYAGTFGKADVTIGGYYFDQDVGYDEVRFLPPIVPIGFYGGGRQDHQVLGAFANVDFALTEQLILTGGLRYSDETKDADVAFVIPRATPCSAIDGTCSFGGTSGFTDKTSFDSLTPKVGVQYFATDDLQAYASWTRGFRSGGYNFRITDPALFLQQRAATGEAAFDQEEADSFEIGTKFTSDDRRIILNAAAFYTDISDLQREVNLPSPTAGVSQFILNTADADILGVEVEGRFALTDAIALTGNVGYIDASYSDVLFDISGDGVVNDVDEDLALPRVPEFTGGAGVIASVGPVTGRVNYQYRDEVAYTDNNLGFIQDIHRLDANLSWMTPVEGVEVSLYAKNILDEVQAGGDTQTPFAGPLSTGVADPFAVRPVAGTFSPLKKGRLFGVELTYEWGE